MSYVGFHVEEAEAHLSGSERAHARHLVLSLATPLFLDLFGRNYMALSRFVDPPPNWVTQKASGGANHPEFIRDLRLWVENDSPRLIVCGEPIGYGELALNTALVAGNPTIRLMAYISGSCEDHAYFAPPHGAVLNAIAAGRQNSILRPDVGWEKVSKLFEEHPEETVVLDFSVSESWPDPDLIAEFPGWDEDGEKADLWLDENRPRLHALALEGLKAAKWPINFAVHLTTDEPQGYLSGRSVFDLAEDLR